MNRALVYPISKKILLLSKLPLISLKSFWIFSLSAIIFLLAFYVFQINTLISASYQVQNYQKEMAELLDVNKALEINFAKIHSLENIEPKIEELGFEKIGIILYIQVLETSIATK